MLMIGFQGHSADRELLALVRDPLVTGVIWFRRNIVSPLQVASVNAELRAVRPNLIIAIDQEGGAVRRLVDGVPMVPAMRSVQSTGEARRWGLVLAGFLRPLGFTLNLAPVLDVDSNPQNPIIGSRAFSADADEVAARAIALAQGQYDGGLASCGKHFPGHGDTDLDSHLALPTVRHGPQRLWDLELRPFRQAVAAEIDAIMSAHIVLPAFDPDLPATLSPPVLRILREDLGFRGPILSDDLEMKAIADHWSMDEVVERAVDAGIDQLLVCSRRDLQEQALNALRRIHTLRRAESLARLAPLG